MRPEIKLTVFLVAAVLTWGTIFSLAGCSNSPKRKARTVAERALYAIVENPNSVKILAVSKPDSVFGREYITMEEQMSIAKAMMKVNQEVMRATDGFDNINPADKTVFSLMERQMNAMSAMRSIVRMRTDKESKKQPFTGWKVKIDYQAQTAEGIPYRAECWLFLDKEATCVVKSFEIPII